MFVAKERVFECAQDVTAPKEREKNMLINGRLFPQLVENRKLNKKQARQVWLFKDVLIKESCLVVPCPENFITFAKLYH